MSFGTIQAVIGKRQQNRKWIKEIIIKDSDLSTGRDIYSYNKIYENEFILEYKINHPREVLNAIDEGATITPVMSINTETLKYSDYVTIPTNYFNYEPLPPGLPESLPETPEYSFHDEHILVRALPKLNCLRNTNLQKVVQFTTHTVSPSFNPALVVLDMPCITMMVR